MKRKLKARPEAHVICEAESHDEEPSLAFWDLLEEFCVIRRHAKANGAPPLLTAAIGAVRDTNVTARRRPDATKLAKAVQVFWDLPEPDRAKIFNGWRVFRPDNAATRLAIETILYKELPMPVLTLTSKADREVSAWREEITNDITSNVRVHVRVGTSQNEALAALDAIWASLQDEWPLLITDPESIRRRASQPRPFKPKTMRTPRACMSVPRKPRSAHKAGTPTAQPSLSPFTSPPIPTSAWWAREGYIIGHTEATDAAGNRGYTLDVQRREPGTEDWECAGVIAIVMIVPGRDAAAAVKLCTHIAERPGVLDFVRDLPGIIDRRDLPEDAPVPLVWPGADSATKHANAPGQVWECFGGRDMDLLAFLVTEKGNPQRPIAIAPLDSCEPALLKKEIRLAKAACRAVAADPNSALGNGDVIDLRAYCRPDSPYPLLLGYFGLALAREGEGWMKAKTTFWPFCRFAIARMLGLTDPKGEVASAE